MTNKYILKDSVSSLVSRLRQFFHFLNVRTNTQVAKVVPKENPAFEQKRQSFDGGLSSGYFSRAVEYIPKERDKAPWKGMGMNYIRDLIRWTQTKQPCHQSSSVINHHQSYQSSVISHYQSSGISSH